MEKDAYEKKLDALTVALDRAARYTERLRATLLTIKLGWAKDVDLVGLVEDALERRAKE